MQSFLTVLASLAVVRALGALVSIMDDGADETFNQWEALFNALYGGGFQCWEHHYGLRSALYIWLHALAVLPSVVGWPEKRVIVFYALRMMLGLLSALCEATLVSAATKSYGHVVGEWLWLLLACSAGMFHASVSFLPSSFAMYCVTLALAYWTPDLFRPRGAIALMGLGAVVGWPFAAIMGGPMALDLASRADVGLKAFAVTTVCVGLGLGLAVAAADTVRYGRIVVSTLSLLRYNILEGGSVNYGVEPWTWYFKNLAINFNGAFPAAVAALPVVVAVPQHVGPMAVASMRQLRAAVSLVWVWLAVFSLQAHKEQRFAFIAYPAICLGAAVGFAALEGVCKRRRMVPWLVRVAFVAVCVSRIAAVCTYYRAPFDIFSTVSQLKGADIPDDLPARVPDAPGTHCAGLRRLCMGADWHRFPGSLWLPADGSICLSFLESEFKGQLPAPYAPAATAPQARFNTNNAEEKDRYVPLGACHLVVDVADVDSAPPRGWALVDAAPIIDPSRSPALTRAFFIPWLSGRKNHFQLLRLLGRRSS